MSLQLHFVHRLGFKASYEERAFDLVQMGRRDTERRVIEVFTPTAGLSYADLALGERELPEVLSLLHRASEVHVHGLSLELALRVIPFIRPDALQNTPLTLHGPWVPPPRELATDATRYQEWPGPVILDEIARRQEEGKVLPEPPEIWLDPNAAPLLPRLGGPVPLKNEDGLPLAVITLDSLLAEGLRHRLRSAIHALGDDELAFEIRDEADMGAYTRPRQRRYAQTLVALASEHRGVFAGRALLEGLMQELPNLCFGRREPTMPEFPELTWLEGDEEEDKIEAVLAALRAFVPAWKRFSSPCQPGAGRAWVKQNIAGARKGRDTGDVHAA